MERSFIVSLPNLSPVVGAESGAEMVHKVVQKWCRKIIRKIEL